jgi:parallel beta-helix repeat protein/predicted outer membrane repeat protein
VIQGNTAPEGGGIYCVGSQPTIENCLIQENSTSGIWVDGGEAVIRNCTIRCNIGGNGGGIFFKTHCDHGTVENCALIENTAISTLNGGGGLCSFAYVDLSITKNRFQGNVSFAEGGGLYCTYCSVELEGNVFVGNRAESHNYGGGGAYLSQVEETLPIRNNIFARNTTSDRGGGLYLRSSSPVLSNNTFTWNEADESGGGLQCNSAFPETTNCIFWENRAHIAPEIAGTGSILPVTFSIVKGGWTGLGNLREDPRFVDPEGDDYHLDRLSPGINRGTLQGASFEDLDGDPRPTLGLVDIGADEFTGLHPLEADAYTVQESAGCDLRFLLDAGPAKAGRNYVLIGSVTGIAPCFSLPGGLATVPLSCDFFTQTILGYLNTPLFHDFLGALDGNGRGGASLNTHGPMPPGSAGHTMYFAYCLGYPWEFASNPIAVEVVP